MKSIKFILLSFIIVINFFPLAFAMDEKKLFDEGVKLFKQTKYEQAVEKFSKLLKTKPNDADTYKNRGVAYMKLGKFNLAINDFKKVKTINPNMIGIHSNLGVIWHSKKKYEKAIENYNQEIKLSPNNYVAYYNRALSYYKLNKLQDSLADIEKTLELKPNFYWGICYKAELFAKTDKIERARAIYKKAIALSPEKNFAKAKLAQLNLDSIYPQTKQTNTEHKTQKEEKIDTPDTFAIQVGVYQNQANAKRMLKQLSQKGFDARILNLKSSSGKTFFLLRSGNYATKKDAIYDLKDVGESLNMKPIIRPTGKW